MDSIFSGEWNGDPFILFGSYHLSALGVIVLVNILLVYFGRGWSESTRTKFRWGLAVLLIGDELLWHIWNIQAGLWNVQTMLPFHLCSVLVYVSAYMLVTKNYRLYEFVYLLGIAGATQALLTPDAGKYGFPHFRAIQTMVSHGAIVTAAIYMTAVEKFRPTWQSFKRVLLYGNLYMAVIFVLNLAIGSNYLFIAHKPETASLLDMLPAWPVYILFIEMIALVVCLLLMAPFAVGDLWKKRAR